MGCCISRPSGPNSPYPGGAGASGSARAINNASAPQTAGGTSSNATGGGGGGGGGNDRPLPSPGSGSRRSARRRQGGTQSLTQHINKPLRRHEWSSRNNRVWTAAALARERAEFFDTRVAERQEIWQAIRAALEVLWAADAAAREGRRARARAQAQQEDTEEEGPSLGEEDDPAIALATAQSILTAADITLPTGDLANGAYDALGNYYSMPEHVVSDPLNIARDSDGRDTGALADAKADLTAGEETADENDLDEVERRREEKGKAVVDVRDQITVRLRLSDGSRDVNIAVGKDENVRSIARRAVDEAQLPSNKKIRIAYMGKILKETSPLLVQGWKQGHVVNALVFNR